MISWFPTVQITVDVVFAGMCRSTSDGACLRCRREKRGDGWGDFVSSKASGQCVSRIRRFLAVVVSNIPAIDLWLQGAQMEYNHKRSKSDRSPRLLPTNCTVFCNRVLCAFVSGLFVVPTTRLHTCCLVYRHVHTQSSLASPTLFTSLVLSRTRVGRPGVVIQSSQPKG